MSKTNWISVALDGSVDGEEIRWLLERSYDLTASVTTAAGPNGKCAWKRILQNKSRMKYLHAASAF